MWTFMIPMMWPIQALILSVFAYSGTCSGVPSVVNRHPVPEAWSRVARAPREHVIQLSIAVKQDRFDELEERLSRISHPANPEYRQHLSAREVHELTRPSQAAQKAIDSWLSSHMIPPSDRTFSPSGDWVYVRLLTSTAEQLLNTEYFAFQHVTGQTIVRAPEWALPEHLREYVDDIQPTTSFFRAYKPQRTDFSSTVQESVYTGINRRDNGAGFSSPKDVCNTSAVTPLCLRTLYGTINYEPQKASVNRMALLNFHGETNNRSDIHLFLQKHRPEAASVGAAFDFQDEDIAGGINTQQPATQRIGREGNLDAQVMLGIGFPLPLVTYTVGDVEPPFDADTFTQTNTNEPFLTWLQYLLAQPNPLPTVVSISYGDIEQTVPYAYAKRVCDSFAQLGARGVSVIFGAGDSGVGHPGACIANDGSNTPQFLSVFPEACPYGTSVGATRNIDPEVVAYNDDNGFVSGGGFSRYFARPSWQDEAVGQYLEGIGSEHEGMYERKGRGYPDVAAQGYRFVTVWNATTELVDGTSASSPTFGAIIALLNDALIAEGKPPMGFLNPWLYAQGYRTFTDIVDGSNKGCNTSGFPAKPGWDAASGFGTPWFPALKELALQSEFRDQRPWYMAEKGHAL